MRRDGENRGKQSMSAEQAVVSEARSTKKNPNKSRFTVLEDLTEEYIILESI